MDMDIITKLYTPSGISLTYRRQQEAQQYQTQANDGVHIKAERKCNLNKQKLIQ